MNTKPHALREFDRAIESMRETLANMATCSRYAFELSMRSLMEGSESLADQCIADDQKIDQYELSIDQGVINIQAFFGPMASDMRELLTMMRLSGLLERIGDDSVSIARRTKKVLQAPALSELYLFEPLYLSMRAVFALLMKSYQQRDLEQIRSQMERLPKINEQCVSLSDKIIAAAEQNPERIPFLAEFIFITRSMLGILGAFRQIGEEAECFLSSQ